MEAKTDAHSPQPTRHLGPVLFTSHISTFELLGPAVLRRTPCVLLAAIGCGGVLLISCRLALCPRVPWQVFRLSYRFMVSLSNYRFIVLLSNYRLS